MKPSAKLAELGLELPEVAAPVAAYIPATRVGDQVWTSGQVPFVNGELQLTGKVGAEVSPEQGAQQARVCALNALAAVAAECGGIDNIRRIVKLTIFVASDPSFTGQAAVGNGASELVAEVFGDAGSHVRSAVGVAVLPLGCAVEVEMVAEVA